MATIRSDLKLKNDPSTIVHPNIEADNIPAFAIDGTKIASGAITFSKIGDGEVITAKLNDGAVTTAKINDGAVTGAKIANSTITNNKIVSVDYGKITGKPTSITTFISLRKLLDTCSTLIGYYPSTFEDFLSWILSYMELHPISSVMYRINVLALTFIMHVNGDALTLMYWDNSVNDWGAFKFLKTDSTSIPALYLDNIFFVMGE